MVDIPRQSQPLSAAAAPIVCQAPSAVAAEPPLFEAEGGRFVGSQGGRIAGVGHSSGGVQTASMAGQENRAGLVGINDRRKGNSAEGADGRVRMDAEPAAEGSSRPDQQVGAGVSPGVDLWAADDGEDDWDADLAQLISSAAAFRPAPDGAARPPQPQPAAGPSGRGALAPAGPAAYTPHPPPAQQVISSSKLLQDLVDNVPSIAYARTAIMSLGPFCTPQPSTCMCTIRVSYHPAYMESCIFATRR